LDITPYIRELILSSECVILRGFGGFDTTYRNAALDKSKKLILPPGKKITFRPDWTKDNGILENYISKSLKIKSEEASKYIDLFVNELLTRLENEGSVLLPEIGSFRRGKARTIEFHELEDETYLADSFGLDTLDIETETPHKETSFQTELKPILPERRKMTGWFVVIGLLLLSIMVASLIYISGKEGISIFSFSKKTDKASDKSEVIVFGKKTDVLEDSVMKTIEQTLDKNTIPKKALTPDNISTEVVHPKEIIEPAIHSYLLVAGSFKNIKNAEIMKARLEKRGFKPEILTNEGNYVRVIIGKFDNKDDAITELQRIRGQINQSVWLMEK
jgi:nucleoid DNA-binding protein